MTIHDILLAQRREKEEGLTEETWEGAVYSVRAMPVWKWMMDEEQRLSLKATQVRRRIASMWVEEESIGRRTASQRPGGNTQGTA